MNDIDAHAVGYDFVKLGEGLADSLIRAAQEQVDKAIQILDQTKSMAEIIRTQVKAQAKQIEEMNARFKQFGEQMLDAHRILNGDVGIGEQGTRGLVTPHRVVERQEPPHDLARLRALDALKHGRLDPADEIARGRATLKLDRENRAADPARHGKFPSAVGGSGRSAVGDSQGEDRPHHGIDDKAF